MTNKRFAAMLSLVLALSLALAYAGGVSAQPGAPGSDPAVPAGPPEPLSAREAMPGGSVQTADGLWAMPAGGAGLALPGTEAPLSTGGPDDFGYRWDDTAPLNWINASGGVDTGINGGVVSAGPFNMGFPFKYYENTYSQLYVSRYGFLAFGADVSRPEQNSSKGPE